MRLLGMAVLMMTTAGAAWADDAYIRLEAWREPAEAAVKAQGWAARFPDIVTYPAGGWTAIGLGPLGDDARARMAALKAEGRIPRDAYLVTLGEDFAVTPVTPVIAGAVAAEAAQEGEAVSEAAAPVAQDEATGTQTATAQDEATPDVAAANAAQEGDAASEAEAPVAQDEAAPDATVQAEPAEPQAIEPEPTPTHLRLEAFALRDEAEAALARWRAVLPGAALWQLPDGWHAVTAGPIAADRAAGWLANWKAAGAIPADAFAATEDQLGTPLKAGASLDPDAAPPVPPDMPPIELVQEALIWAGRYQGAMDGRPGPQTNAAIAAEMAAQGINAATPHAEAMAMQALLARREAWRDEMGLAPLTDAATGLEITVPVERLEFLRLDRGLSIYGPKDGSGAALILFNQPGGRAQMEDLAGLITALGWVGHPVREMGASRFVLDGSNDTHIGHAEGHVVDGNVQGFVLIWPLEDAQNAPRLVAVASETLMARPSQD